MKAWIAGLVSLVAVAGTARAEGVWIGEPVYAGTGCPQGTLSVPISPDGKSVGPILFGELRAEAGQGLAIARASCAIAIPVQAHGYQVGVSRASLRGFASLETKTQADYSAEVFFGGAKGPKLVKKAQGPLDSDVVFDVP